MKSTLPSEQQVHPIEPIFSHTSKILILGSFPSVQSRAELFYYAHPQNRFWRVLAAVLKAPLPQTTEEKRELILSRELALWDVIASCRITGSSDSSIAEVQPTDLSRILSQAPIRQICVNGRTAEKYYRRYLLPTVGIEPTVLPSTSAANAAWSLERLIQAWQIIQLERLP